MKSDFSKVIITIFILNSILFSQSSKLNIDNSHKNFIKREIISENSVVNNQIELLTPNGGERVLARDAYTIMWTGKKQDEIKIEMSFDGGGSWENIFVYDIFISDYEVLWSVPDTSSDLCMIKIIDLSDSNNFDISGWFMIYPGDLEHYNYISVNECFMWIGNNGMSSHDPIFDNAGFYWPGGKDAEIASIFADGIVWGGKHDGMVKVNGSTFRYGLTPGEILPNGSAGDANDPMYKIYKINKNWEQIYGPEREILEYDFENWPGDLGAPYIDVNFDGIFTKGIDEPDFIGDEVLFYVANDLDSSSTAFVYGSPPIGLEFQQTVFGFNVPELKDAVFKKAVLINKSDNPVDSMYISYWSDDDLGEANDDYVGVDTVLNLGYTFNSNNDDYEYGSSPPAVGKLLLQGPIIKSIPEDSAKFDNKIIKGYRNLEISSFNLINKSAAYSDITMGMYKGTLEYYNNMKGLFWDGQPYIDPITGDTTKFCVPGDPVNGIGWYEGEGWPNNGSRHGDRRHVMNVGPFTMAPGDTQEVVYAIFMAKGTDHIQCLAELKKSARILHEFWGNEIPVNVKQNNNIIPTLPSLSQNYPNPFNPITKINYALSHKSSVVLRIFDILGREVETLVNDKQNKGKYEVEFNGTEFSSGIYFYRLKADNFIQTKKMILLK